MAERDQQTGLRLKVMHALVQCERCRAIHSYLIRSDDQAKVPLGPCRVGIPRGICGGELYLLHRTGYSEFTHATSKEGSA